MRSMTLLTPSAFPRTCRQEPMFLSVAIVGQEDTKPVVQLGIKGRDKDGWYPLSTVTISR